MKSSQIRNELHILKEKVRRNPANYKTYDELGNFYSKHGNYNGAIQAYQRSIKLNPKSADILNSLGLVLWNLKRYQEALKYYRRALRINSRHPYAHLNIGNAFNLIGDKANAIAHTNFAVKLFNKTKDRIGKRQADKQLRKLMATRKY